MDTLKPEYRNKIVEIYGRIAFEDESLPARIEGVIFEHPASNQSICYKTKPYHDMQDGFICPIQSINLLSDSTISFEDYKYFPILIETLKKMESEKLIKLN
jgi:hypothetical protein